MISHPARPAGQDQAQPNLLDEVAQRFTVQTTPFLERLMAGAGPDDPVARQFRPSIQELVVTPEELADPIGDDVKSPVPGIVHRYPDRVLLKPVHVCAAYCRFCFRREVVGTGGETLREPELAAALDYIRQNQEIWEVILTGGDPLLLSPRRIEAVVTALGDIEHLGVVRFHTRLPVHAPERITDDLVAALKASRSLTPWVAVHVNHAREFAPEVRAALAKLADAGIPLVSQTVLLKDINDDVEALDALFRTCVRNRVKPYYLHHPDMARGTGHFRISVDEGKALVKALRGRLSGLAQPTYVLDRPNGLGKVPVGPHWPADWADDEPSTGAAD